MLAQSPQASSHAELSSVFERRIPVNTPYAERTQQEVVEFRQEAREGSTNLQALVSNMHADLARRMDVRTADSTTLQAAVEAHLDAEIDGYRDPNTSGQPRAALPRFEPS